MAYNTTALLTLGTALSCALLIGALPAGDALQREDHAAADAERSSGHRRMVDLLARVAERSREDHFFLGDRLAGRLRDAIARLGPNAPAQKRWKLHHQSGVVELRLGNVHAAIERFSHAARLLPAARISRQWSDRTRFDLALAYLRLGEVENCCQRTTPESCVLPIRGGGRHARPEGSRRASAHLREILDAEPPDRALRLKARWLLNVAAMTLGVYPDGVPEKHRISPRAFAAETEFPRFANVAQRLGLDTVNLSGGAIVDDFDRDGDLDLVTSTWDTQGAMHYFRHEPDGTFRERTEAAGLAGLLGGLNLKQADYDGDGDLDILVLRGAWLGAAGRHPNSLLENRGGRFTDVTFASGLGEIHWPTQTAAWADYDRDGDLDLYIGNEHTDQLAAPCQLFRNSGDGTFTDVAAAAGVENGGYSKGVAWGDYDGDGFPDLYVSNLSGANRLYRNRGDGSFVDVAPRLGVSGPEVSFPVWFWDFDNDGVLDIFVCSYAGRVSEVAAYYAGEPVRGGVPCLYRGDGHGGFREVAEELGLARPMLAMGSNFGDVNGDGYLDFYLGTGDPDYASLMPNLMYVNQAGKRFTDVTIPGGFGHLQKGHSVAFADLDHDGDLDVFEQMGGAFAGDAFADALYENPGFGHRWLCVELVGVASNRSAIGARLHVRIAAAEGERSIYRYVTSGGSFGASPLRQTIGLGNATRILYLEVLWPRTGKTQRFSGLELDAAVRITEGTEDVESLSLAPLKFKAP